MAELAWLGHSAFKIVADGVSVLIDPFLDGNPKCPISSQEVTSADIVLVTHDHGDHTGQAVDICRHHNAMLGAVVGTTEKMVAQGLPAHLALNGIGFNIGGTVEHKNVQITMVPAFHTSESGVPVGYIIRMPSGLTIYHAGDTCLYGDMELWGKLHKIDVALLPIGGVFTMDARQAAVACSLLRPRKVVPMHWGTFPVLAPDPQEFQHEVASQCPATQCIVMLPGKFITI